MRRWFISILMCLVLTMVGLTGIGLADITKDYPGAKVLFQSDNLLLIYPQHGTVPGMNGFMVQLFGVAPNPMASGGAMLWFGRHFSRGTPLNVRITYVSDPNGRMASLGAMVSINGVDVGTALAQNHIVVANGICYGMANNRPYCRRLLQLSGVRQTAPGTSGQRNMQGRGFPNYGPQTYY